MKYTLKDAALSEDGLFRYMLMRQWDPSLSTCCFIMLNPSTADAYKDDPTIRRCVGFAAREGCGQITVVNLFAFRTAYPKALFAWRDERHQDVTGNPINDVFIHNAARDADLVIAAWGAQTKLGDRDKAVETIVRSAGQKLLCLGTTRQGHPRHPVRLASNTPLQFWRSP
jgi:hypothetical protein